MLILLSILPKLNLFSLPPVDPGAALEFGPWTRS